MAVLAVCLVTLSYPLHGDVRHEIGVQAVSGHSAAGTFSHRPLLYRLIVSVLAWPADLVTTSTRSFELVLRVEAVGVALVACILLWLGLRRHRPGEAFPLAAVVFAALVLMSPSAVLQPDWSTVVLTVAGVGLALVGRGELVPGLLGGVLLAAAAAVKVVTLPVALIGLLAIALISRRRALIAVAAAVVAGLGYVGVVALWVPHEIGWMLDIRLLQPLPRPWRTQVARVGEHLANVVVIWPLVALIPAAMVGLPTRLKVAIVAAASLAWAPVPIQDQFFYYQSPALPVVAAVVVLLALNRAPTRVLPSVFLLLIAGWTAWVLATPHPTLPARLTIWVAVAILIGLVAWIWQLKAAHAVPVRPASMLAALAVAVTFFATATPLAAQSVSLGRTAAFNPKERAAATVQNRKLAVRLRNVVGRESTVTYLAFGETIYFLRNPTDCRFPSPVFLQRSRYEHDHEGSRSWAETLGCIRDSPGQWLVREVSWFRLTSQPPEVIDVLTATFDCDRAVKVDGFLVCPRRL